MKKLPALNSYKLLAHNVLKEFSDMEFFVRQRTAQGYRRVGKFIHEHLLEYKERADYGAALYERLAEDVGRDKTTLTRATQFYRAYPILAERQELTWEHYRSLITVKDSKERKSLEQKVISHNWNSTKLREYLHAKRGPTKPDNDGKPVPLLTFTRGRLNTYGIIGANKAFIERSPLVLDLGFRQQYLIPTTAARFKEGDHAELVFEQGECSGARKIDIPQENIFTYQARVERVVDGDTLLVSFDFHLDVSISQKLRLRGIDCSELDAEEGEKAKRFVESRLKGCEFIVVKTYKDRADKFDRYLADVFSLEGATSPAEVAEKGIYLNQELLDERLAVIWK